MFTLIRHVVKKGRSLRTYATATANYPYSNVVAIQDGQPAEAQDRLVKGKGLMLHLAKSLVSPDKRHMMEVLFSRRHSQRLLPGSVLTVGLSQPPYTFSGVLISTRRRGIDTSFVLRNVVQRVGVEMQFFVNSPDLKSIELVRSAGSGNGREGKRVRRAKLFYLRHSPEKMSAISGSVKR